MKKPGTANAAFDPYLEQLVVEVDTSSDRIHDKLNDRYAWCFCEMCWRPTEYSETFELPEAVKILDRGNGKSLPMTDIARAKAKDRADAVVERYERALRGEYGRFAAAKIWNDYCDVVEMRGDRSVEEFRDHVERRMRLTEWARAGALLRPTRLPKQTDSDAKPSKLYCAKHNPRRNEDARRAYQRDRRFAAKYDSLIEQIWKLGIYSAKLATWDIEDHRQVRKEAYRQIQAIRSPTSLIDEFLEQGETSQAEIARHLGISRQAVSAAMRRKKKKTTAP